MPGKPNRYGEFLSAIGSVMTRPKVSEKEFEQSFTQWREDGKKIIGYPSEIPTLISHLENEMMFSEQGWSECWTFARENEDIFELNVWVYKTSTDGNDNQDNEVVLEEVITELSECISTIVEMWSGLLNDQRHPVESGIKRLKEAQEKFERLVSDL